LSKNSQGVCNGMRGDYGSCVDSPFSVLIGGFLNFVRCVFNLSLIIIFVGFHCIMLKYHLRAEMKRPLLNKDLQSQAEFIVENKVKLYYLLVLLLTSVLFLQH